MNQSRAFFASTFSQSNRSRTVIWLALSLLPLLAMLDFFFPPPVEQFLQARAAQVVVAQDGSVLRAFADQRGIWRHPIELDQLSPNYLQILLNYEDRWFFRHPGVNPVSLLRASAQGLRYQRAISGGSTISMQVARIIEPIDRSVLGKLKQCARALQLERRLSKRELLTLYLKHAPFGGNIEGVETASLAYLGKSAAQLTDAEAALLVVLPQRPSRLRPDRHPQRAQTARDKVLARMVELQVWPAIRAQEAKLESVIARKLSNPMLAPLLSQRLHQQSSLSLIQTGIDANWQRMSEARARSAVNKFSAQTSVSILIVDTQTMLAKAYVGSAQFADTKSFGHIDMVQALRSPGSTLKPTLYGMAIDEGLIHSESLLIDAPQDFQGFRPGNFFETFNGPVSAAQALRLSLNVPAVDLLDRIGPGKFSARLEHAGLDLKMPPGSAVNLSLILGGAGTDLQSLVSIHAALARRGLAAKVRYQTSEPLQNRHLMSEGAAWITYQMLAQANQGNDSALFAHASKRAIAYKTGTSFGFRDAWALGTTGEASVGVWIGRPDGTPNPGSFGAVSALPLLFEVFAGLPANQVDAEPEKPTSVTEAKICWPLGRERTAFAADLCHRQHQAMILSDTIPPTLPVRGQSVWQSGIEQILVDRNGKRRNASCLNAEIEQVQIARWPALLYPWLSLATLKRASPPPLHPSCRPEAAQNALIIEGIVADSLIRPTSNRSAANTTIGVRALGAAGEVKIRWLLDSLWLGESSPNQQFVFALPAEGKHRLLALDPEGRYAAVDFSVAH